MAAIKWGLGILIILLVIYLSPFLLSPLMKFTAWLGGFFLGHHKRKVLLSYSGQPNGKGATTQVDIDAINAKLKQEAENEFKMLEDNVEKQETRLNEEIEELKRKIAEVQSQYETGKIEIKQNLVAKAFDKTKEQFNQETGKNILLLIFVAAILLCDTIIARQIFKSFGLGTDVFSFHEHSIEHAWIFGVFVTFISALVLHIFWALEKFKEFLKTKWSVFVGLLIIAAVFVIRIFTFFGDPDRSKALVDSLLIICWLAGVFIVYWLLGEMTGEERDWFKVVVALCAPLLLVLFFLFGGIFLFHFILHWAADRLIESWLGFRAARKKQIIQNSEIRQNAQKAGFYRGLTT